MDRAAQRRHHVDVDPHVRSRWLSDLVLGGQDGIVNTLGVVLGVSSATAETRIILATGLAAAVAEAVSMAAVAFTSSTARGDMYRAERDREYRHIEHTPDVEREVIRALFVDKGFTGELLDRAVETTCSNRDRWVTMMMAEEHGLDPIDPRTSLRSAAVVGGSSLVASVALVLPFIVPHQRFATVAALGVGIALLLALGVLKGRLTTGAPARSAVTLATIGLVSALAGYGIGRLVGAV